MARDKAPGAWTAEQTVGFMLDRLVKGHFVRPHPFNSIRKPCRLTTNLSMGQYIIVPDNETSEELDRLRMAWSARDAVEGRPALSRWHPEYKAEFEAFVKEGLGRGEAY